MPMNPLERTADRKGENLPGNSGEFLADTSEYPAGVLHDAPPSASLRREPKPEEVPGREPSRNRRLQEPEGAMRIPVTELEGPEY